MRERRGFALVTSADFIVRSAYQVGKTPLLPIYAAALGAGDAFIGLIVSVSTITGMMIKPFIGLLSDRHGRRSWLLIGTAFFTVMPFTYSFVESQEHLFTVRILHGMATAIYGPVTLAYVAELSRFRQAERLGWFSIARNSGYVIGPGIGGLLLLHMDPVTIFTLIGILSSMAFIPVLLIQDGNNTGSIKRPSNLKHTFKELRTAVVTPIVWATGGLAANGLLGIYAAKTFLPIHAMSIGINPAVTGGFFVLQEGIHIVLSPAGGRFGDRIGHGIVTGIGLTLIGTSLALLATASTVQNLVVPAALMGIGQALFFPSNLAMASGGVEESNLGFSLGFLGSFRNVGKVAGPIIGGVLIRLLGFESAFHLIGVVIIMTAVVIPLARHTGFGIYRRGVSQQPESGDTKPRLVPDTVYKKLFDKT